MRIISNESIGDYFNYLVNEEKAPATIKKYIRDILDFSLWLSGKAAEKSDVIEYKAQLNMRYAPSSVNAILASVNGFFSYMGWYDLKVKALKIQRQIFASAEKELSKNEYERLVRAARESNNMRLYLLMQTICSTGIRVSELSCITAESVSSGVAYISCKGKRRQVFLPKQLCRALKKYIGMKKIKNGPIFTTKSGKPLDRSNIWSEMKKLCNEAGVSEKKVFPHNLRHLFARTYYNLKKDVVRLADILGHSNINTTRIYTIESGEVHRKQVEMLGLLLC